NEANGEENRDGTFVGLALDPAVLARSVGRPVAVLLAVRLVVLLGVADEIPQGEPVVRRDEVQARARRPPARAVDVARSGETRAEIGDRPAIPAPEAAHRVAVAAVVLGPQNREAADAVAALAEVPGLGDELHLRQDRVLVDRREEGALGVEAPRRVAPE